MRVLLITPPGGFTTKAAMPPLGLLSLAAVLRDDGHTVTVRDYAGWGLGRARFLRDVRRLRPEAVGIAVLTESRFAAAAAARAAKRFDPAVRVIVGGPHPSGAPDDTARCPHFDVVVAGQAEAVIARALEADERIVHATPPANLDDLPIPAREGVCLGRSLPPGRWRRRTRPDRVFTDRAGRDTPGNLMRAGPGAHGRTRLAGGQSRTAHLVTSRGCPFDCAFCATRRTHGPQWRAHSIGRVMAEVERLRADGAQTLWFYDDVFNVSDERVAGLCEALRRRDPPTPFIASVRADLATREQLAAMRAAGCVRLFFGVESANETALRETCGKSCSVEQALAVARWCDELGIEKNPGYILGLPGETAAEARATLDLMRRIGGRPAVSFLRIYPGTRIERLAVERGLLPRDFSWWDRRALKPLVCRPAFGDTPIFLDGLTWRDVGALAAEWGRIVREPLGRRAWRALTEVRKATDLAHLAAMALGDPRLQTGLATEPQRTQRRRAPVHGIERRRPAPGMPAQALRAGAAALRRGRPNDAPLEVWIEPTDACPGGCRLCPHGRSGGKAKAVREIGGPHAGCAVRCVPRPVLPGRVLSRPTGGTAGRGLHRPYRPGHTAPYAVPPSSLMSPAVFDRVLDAVGRWRPRVNLHHRGEPFLHPGIVHMIRGLSGAGARVSLHTGAHVPLPAPAGEIARAGLAELVISLGAATPEGFAACRPGVDRGTVIDRARELLAAAGRSSTRTIVEVFGIARPRRELAAARELFADTPPDVVRQRPIHNWAGAVGTARGPVRSRCLFPFYAMVVLCDGRVAACPQDFDGRLIVGDVRESDLAAIWHGRALKQLRKRRRTDLAASPPCDACSVVRRRAVMGVPVAAAWFVRRKVLAHGVSGETTLSKAIAPETAAPTPVCEPLPGVLT